MKATVFDNKCKNCNANLKFNPTTQKWDCEYCNSSFDENDFKENKIAIEENQEDINLNEYSCPNCGAIVITDENTTATECIYCGNSTIMKNRLQGKFKPDKIIPFRNTKEEAISAFKNFVKKRWFAPDEFEKEDNIKKVSGVYIPFWLFDCKTNGKVNAECKTIRSWTSGSYRYTKTDIYNCVRSGNMAFIDIPVDGSTKFPDDIMDSIEPYDYNGFKDFNYSYLSGFLAEKYDMESSEVYNRAKLRAENTTVDELTSNLKKYNSVRILSKDIKLDNGTVEYALLPVWMLNIMYNEKMYTFAMNGQTGKMIGNVPIKKSKVAWFFLKSFSGIALILFLITLIFGI